jgi:hypothetical protein
MMTDMNLREHLLAIKQRRELLEALFSKNGRQYERAGLLGFGYAVYPLATRYIQKPEWPGHDATEDVRLGWELEWYSSYLQAAASLVRNLQEAVRNGSLILRDGMSRSPIDTAHIGDWLSLDPAAQIGAAAKRFWATPASEMGIIGNCWADAGLLPSAGVDAEEFAAWATSKGIVQQTDAHEKSIFGVPTEQAQPAQDAKPLESWKMRIQAEAATRWKAQRKLGCNPTRRSIQGELAKWCRDNNILTATGINPSEAYIYSHVIAKRVWQFPGEEAS